MWKGLSTNESYDECLDNGICPNHAAELHKESNGVPNHELQRKAFLYIRLHIFDPILFGKPFLSGKMKTLLQASTYFSESMKKDNFAAYKDSIMVLDSVVVFILCRFCQICCAGCLFSSNCEPEIKDCYAAIMKKLLSTKKLEQHDIGILNPILQKNFKGYNEDFIKFCYVTVLLFVRNVTRNVTLGHALKELDLKLQTDNLNFQLQVQIGALAYKEERYQNAIDNYTSALSFNPYCCECLSSRAQAYIKVGNFKEAELDGYVAVMINPAYCKGYCKLSAALFHQNLFKEAFLIAEYGLKKCEDNSLEIYEALESLKIEADIKCTVQNVYCNEETVPSSNSKVDANDKVFHTGKNEDIPDLIEASDDDESDSEAELENDYGNKLVSEVVEKILKEDIPELMEASDSDGDSEGETSDDAEADKPDMDTKEKQGETSDEKESEKPDDDTEENQVEIQENSKTDSVQDLSSSSQEQKKLSEEEIKLKYRRIKSLLKEASQAVMKECGHLAIRFYREALDELKDVPQSCDFEECDIVCTKYAYGLAYCKSGTYDDLQKSITIFKEIIEEHHDVTFPATYYGLGLVFCKLNRFKDALNYLKIVQDILEKGIHFRVYTWPGITAVINETKADHLKVLVQEMIKECTSPPAPNATCRYENCYFYPSIYYTDPGFKGFYSIECSEQCNLQFHPQCWKDVKNVKVLSDKEFLEKQCLTPDCDGTITKLESINKEGSIAKVFSFAKTKASKKQRKTKLEKKLEVKEEKRRKRKDSKCEVVSELKDDVCETPHLPETESVTVKVETKEKKETINVPVTALSVDAQPFIILKKDIPVNENTKKVPTKVKESKKAKGNTLSIEEFCNTGNIHSNEYKERLTHLRQYNESIVENHWTEETTNSDIKPFDNKEVVEELENVPVTFEPPSSYLNTYCDIDESECIKNNIYSFLEEILSLHGPLRIDSSVLMEELKSFPHEANVMIADSGGIGGFLKKNVHFAVVKDTYVCVVSDVATAYEKYNRYCLRHTVDNQLENFESQEINDDDSNHLLSQSYLNPDAKEYSPFIASMSTMPVKVNADLCSGEGDTKLDCNHGSNSLISVISKFRQPLTVDTGSTNQSQPYNTFAAEMCKQEIPPASKKSDITLNSDFCLPNSISVKSKEEMLDLEIKNLLKVLKHYFSDELKQHHSYIDSHLKPYVIMELPKQNSKCIQTEKQEVLTVSTGTMTTGPNIVDELERVKNLVVLLNEDKAKLTEEKILLEQKVSLSMDATIKHQKKYAVDIESLRRELEDANDIISNQTKDYKSKEIKWEKEQKGLLESLNKAYADIEGQKKEIANLVSSNESMKTCLGQLEQNVSLLLDDKEAMRKCHEIQERKFQELSESLQAEKNEILKRAKSAELQSLHLKKSEYLKRIDIKTAEAAQKIKELQSGIALLSDPLIASNMKVLLSQIGNYINRLGAMRLDFTINIDEQIREVTNGTPLGDLKQLVAKDLPEIPSWTSQLPISNAISVQGIGTPLQPLSSALPLNSACGFTGADAVSSRATLPKKMEKAGFGLVKNSIPHPSSSMADTSSLDLLEEFLKPDASKIPSTLSAKKLPPGIQDPDFKIQYSHKFPTASSEGKLKQPIINSSASPVFTGINLGQPTSNNTEVYPSTDPTFGAFSRSSVYSSTSSINGKSSEKEWGSSLELGYNVGKSGIQQNTASANVYADSSVKKVSGPKNSYEKLLTKLHGKYPNYSQAELMTFVKEFRRQLKGGFSGLPLDQIISQLSVIIDSNEKTVKSVPETAFKNRSTVNKVLVNKKLASEPKATETLLETSAAQRKMAWSVNERDSNRPWSGNNVDNACVICLEEMTFATVYKAECGHSFHSQCIREWLSKKSDCPTCRVHLLLPEDYPTLS